MTSTLASRQSQPRIALLYDCVYPFVPGGGQKRLYEIAKRLVAKGWQIDWYGLKSWPETGSILVDGIRLIPVSAAGALYREDGKRSILQTFRYGAAIAKFPTLRDYDLIHMGQWPYFHFFPVWLYTAFAKTKISADWWEVWARHWLDYYGWKGLLGVALERLCARIPTALIAISETGARQLNEIGVKKRLIHVVHNGIDGSAIRSAAPAEDSSDLIYVGRLQPHKNVDCLVQALGRLRDKGHRLSLSIVGDGPERKSLEAMTAQLELEEQVKFLGALPTDAEVHRHLKAARIFVHPSTKEGGGSITSLEANAAGLAVVAFDHPGGISPELIEEGMNGYWVTDVHPDALATVILTASQAQDEDARKARCVAFARQFDWDVLAEQYHAFFLSQLGQDALNNRHWETT